LIASCPRASAEKFLEGSTKKILKNSKKRPKNSTIKPLPRGPTKKRPKIALLSLFQGGNGKTRPKNSKKDRKIALLGLYLLYPYHV